MCGVYCALCLPRRVVAITVARRPSVLPSASTTYQFRATSPGFAFQVFITRGWRTPVRRRRSVAGSGITYVLSMRYVLVACIVASGFLVVATIGSAQGRGAGPGLRYCKRPGGPGNYLAASPSVSCATARKVEAKVFSSACVQRTRCLAYGFTCLAFWDGRYDRP